MSSFGILLLGVGGGGGLQEEWHVLNRGRDLISNVHWQKGEYNVLSIEGHEQSSSPNH